ncbi:MAG TPA: hypothetical protein VFV53_09370 [Candidatus Limnocylindrales bacterium]|nr:hypothetical protein [Candidatus Limnocylindrales bacterium]
MAGAPDDPVAPPLPIVAPIIEAPWSADFVAQTLEVFIVCRGPAGLANLRPVHAPSLRLAMGVGREPAELVLAAVARYELRPIVVHSTSWRSEPGRILLSYVAVVEAPASPSPFLVAEPIGRVDLARGDATAAPAAIATTQVLEHALRHLSWLVRDDPAVAAALDAWGPDLEAYVPEPFRNL